MQPYAPKVPIPLRIIFVWLEAQAANERRYWGKQNIADVGFAS
jgi:hypothetical protein